MGTIETADRNAYPEEIRRMPHDELRVLAKEPMSTDPARFVLQAKARGEYAERRFAILASSICEASEVRRATPVEDAYMATDAVVTMRDGRVVRIQVKNASKKTGPKRLAREFGAAIVSLPPDLPDGIAILRIRNALGLFMQLPTGKQTARCDPKPKGRRIAFDAMRWEDDGGFVP